METNTLKAWANYLANQKHYCLCPKCGSHAQIIKIATEGRNYQRPFLICYNKDCCYRKFVDLETCPHCDCEEVEGYSHAQHKYFVKCPNDCFIRWLS